MLINRFTVEKIEIGESVFLNGVKIGVLEAHTPSSKMTISAPKGLVVIETEGEELPNRGGHGVISSVGNYKAKYFEVKIPTWLPHPHCSSCGGRGVVWDSNIAYPEVILIPCGCYDLSEESFKFLVFPEGFNLSLDELRLNAAKEAEFQAKRYK